MVQTFDISNLRLFDLTFDHSIKKRSKTYIGFILSWWLNSFLRLKIKKKVLALHAFFTKALSVVSQTRIFYTIRYGLKISVFGKNLISLLRNFHVKGVYYKLQQMNCTI